MNKEELQERMAAIERRFSELNDQKVAIDDEQKQLQGAYKVLEELLNSTAWEVEKPKRLRKVEVKDATN